MCHARLNKKIVRVLLGFRLRLGVRDSVGGVVVVVRHRLFNRHFDVPWEKTGLIHLQTLFQLQVGVKLLTDPVSPVCGSNPRNPLTISGCPDRSCFSCLWIQPSIDQLYSHAGAEQGSSTTLRASQIRAGQGSKNVLIQTCMSDFM